MKMLSFLKKWIEIIFFFFVLLHFFLISILNFSNKNKRKSKKGKEQSHDDEKENTSSPTKVKKLEKSASLKRDSKLSSSASSPKHEPLILNENKNNQQHIEDENNNNIQIHDQFLDNNNNNTILLDKPPKSPVAKHITEAKNQQLHVDVSAPENAPENDQERNITDQSPVFSQAHQPRAPVLSASDAAHSCASSAPFVRGNFLSSTISGSELNRFLNSGYLNGDGYLQRGVEPKYPKSPHFHRPPNFSYSRNTPNYVTPRRPSNRGI